MAIPTWKYTFVVIIIVHFCNAYVSVLIYSGDFLCSLIFLSLSKFYFPNLEARWKITYLSYSSSAAISKSRCLHLVFNLFTYKYSTLKSLGNSTAHSKPQYIFEIPTNSCNCESCIRDRYCTLHSKMLKQRC